MRRVRISELVENPISGEWGTEAEDESNGIPVIRNTNFTEDGRINLHDVAYRIITDKKVKKKKLRKGDIIIEKSGGSKNQPVGRVVYFDFDDGTDYLFSNFTSALRPKGNVVPKFLHYGLLHAYQSGRSELFQNKTTGIRNLQLKRYLDKIEIPLPSLDEQKAIVAKLDRAQRLIDIDREMLTKYDDLIQSVFLDMFGNVFSDKIKTPFEDHLEIKHGYAFKSKWFDDEGDVPVVKIGTVNKSNVDFSEVQFLDYSYAKEYERFKVYPGDLLLSMTGTVGKDDYANPCIMTNDFDFYLLNQRVVKLNYDEKVFTKSFLYHFFKQDHIKRELTKFSRGIRQANLSNKDIYGLSFQIPDSENQIQFERLCDLVEQEKRSLKKSAKKSEELFSSLVQGVFN